MTTSPNDYRTIKKGTGKTIDTIATLLDEIASAESREKMWYRGHSKTSYDLVPTIGREPEFAGRQLKFDESTEQNLLHRFRRHAFSHRDRILNDWDALFLARHHGLPTRLLDWTANPLIALFFACTEHIKDDGALWAIERLPESATQDIDTLGSFPTGSSFPVVYPNSKTSPAVKILHPFYNSPRLVNQNGVFTYHSDPWTPLNKYTDDDRFERDRLDICRLIKWTIPANNKPTFIEELYKLGVTTRTAFPDLDGIAKSLWQTEVLFNGHVTGK